MASKTLTAFILVILCFLTLPLIIGFAGGVFGLIMGVFGAFFGVIAGLFGAVFGVIGKFFGGMFHWHHGFFEWSFMPIAIIAILIMVITKRSK